MYKNDKVLFKSDSQWAGQMGTITRVSEKYAEVNIGHNRSVITSPTDLEMIPNKKSNNGGASMTSTKVSSIQKRIAATEKRLAELKAEVNTASVPAKKPDIIEIQQSKQYGLNAICITPIQKSDGTYFNKVWFAKSVNEKHINETYARLRDLYKLVGSFKAGKIRAAQK